MLSKVFSSAVIGIDAYIVEVEVVTYYLCRSGVVEPDTLLPTIRKGIVLNGKALVPGVDTCGHYLKGIVVYVWCPIIGVDSDITLCEQIVEDRKVHGGPIVQIEGGAERLEGVIVYP